MSPNQYVHWSLIPWLPLQVSHHVHCNDEALDEDVFSAFPALRFDARLPRKWYHRFQHIYMVSRLHLAGCLAHPSGHLMPCSTCSLRLGRLM